MRVCFDVVLSGGREGRKIWGKEGGKGLRGVRGRKGERGKGGRSVFDKKAEGTHWK